jgi:hypothetical protein
MEVKLKVEEDPPFALTQLRMREDDQPLLEEETKVTLHKI